MHELGRHQIETPAGVNDIRNLSAPPPATSTGSALDNAVAESFNATFEWELLRQRRFATREQARRAVAGFTDEYNTQRRHFTNGMLSPVDYESAQADAKRATATPTAPPDPRAA